MDKARSSPVAESSVLSPDGTSIGYHVIGNGPGLLVIHGGWRHGMHYIRLAEKLSQHFTVYLMHRRGRMSSGAQGANYSLDKECEDALAIVRKHELKLVFGHSFGGLVAMELALHHPFEKLAVYEPAIFVKGDFPLGWLPRFEQLLEKKDLIGAMITFIKGVKMAGPLSPVPVFLLRPLFRMISAKNNMQETQQLLRQLPAEMRVVNSFSSIDRFAALKMPVLLLLGGKSPAYFQEPMEDLRNILPEVRVEKLEEQGHNAPDEDAPGLVGEMLLNFFTQPWKD